MKKTLTFSLLITAYLIIQGLFRVIVTFAIEVPNPNSARIGGGITILQGLMGRMNWPFSDLWILSFALSAEIANLGWALMFYANAVNKQRMINKPKNIR